MNWRIQPIQSSDDNLTGAVSTYCDVFLDEDKTQERQFAREKVNYHADLPSFQGYVAINDGDVIGLCYGYTSNSERRFEQVIRREVSETVTQQWFEDCFVFEALAVRQEVRRKGIGGQLHDRVLERTDHRRTVLTTGRANDLARKFYRNRGWTAVYDPVYVKEDVPPKVLMGQELTDS